MYSTYKTSWLPEYGRAFILAALEHGGNGERLVDAFIVKFKPNNEVGGCSQFLFNTKLPGDFFDDAAVLRQITEILADKIRGEVHELRMKNGINKVASDLDSKFVTGATLQDLAFALIFGKGNKILFQIQEDTKSQHLTEDLNPYRVLKDSFVIEE